MAMAMTDLCGEPVKRFALTGSNHGAQQWNAVAELPRTRLCREAGHQVSRRKRNQHAAGQVTTGPPA